MKTYDVHDYGILVKHLDAAERKIDAIVDVLRDELSALEDKKRPAMKDVNTAALISERLCNHVLASRYISEARSAMAFYQAVLEGLADEEEDEYVPDPAQAEEYGDEDDASPDDDPD